MKRLVDSLRLFGILPPVLKIAWGLILIGFVGLAAGYFTEVRWQNLAGLGLLTTGYLLALADMLLRNRGRDRSRASGFYVGLTVAPLMAMFIMVIVALLAAVVLAVMSALHGFSSSYALRLLHFLGVILAFLVVSGIPSLAMRVGREEEDPRSVDGGDP